MGITRNSRRPTGNELVFGPLKTLMTGYQIWGSRNACDAKELSKMFRIDARDLISSLRQLAVEGLVLIDDDEGTISLTKAGARALALGGTRLDS